MRELEITTAPELDAQEQRTADLHSLVNVLNIISLQLAELDMDFPKFSEGLVSMENRIRDLANGFQVEEDLAPLVEQLRETEDLILQQLDHMLDAIDDEELQSDLLGAKENFVSIYEILNARLDEFAYRLDQPDVWVEIEAEALRGQMQDVFDAIEKNAKGRYYIHYNLALKNKQDYYIDLRIETSDSQGRIWMPLRLKDVLRDLLANARKYTKPGGKVALALHQSEDCIQCVIEDSGCGIPEGELERVIEFGYRASNVRKYRTMGGGFGLTKAAWLVLRWGGRFQIASAEGEGTRIQINLPNQPR